MSTRPKPSSAGSSRSRSVTAADAAGAAAGAAGAANTSGLTGAGGASAGAFGAAAAGGGIASMSAAEAAAVQFDPPPLYPADIPLVQEAVTSEEARAYLEEFVTPTLAQGLKALCMLRPANPADYLALYLLRANPHVPPEQRGVVEVSTNLDDIAPVPQAEE